MKNDEFIKTAMKLYMMGVHGTKNQIILYTIWQSGEVRRKVLEALLPDTVTLQNSQSTHLVNKGLIKKRERFNNRIKEVYYSLTQLSINQIN